MARAREALGGGVLSARIALSAALFQSVTTSARAVVAVKTMIKRSDRRAIICRSFRRKRSDAVGNARWTNELLIGRSVTHVNLNSLTIRESGHKCLPTVHNGYTGRPFRSGDAQRQLTGGDHEASENWYVSTCGA